MDSSDQSFNRFDVSPVNYTFEIQAMTVLTIGPRVDNHEAMLKYAKLLSSHDRQSNHVKELVEGVIEGETRVLTSYMTMEDVFKGTKGFKKEVFDKVQLELDQFGLLIYNANIKRLVDVQDMNIFLIWMKGAVGGKLREGHTVQNATKIDAETKIIVEVRIFKNQRDVEVAEANAELSTKKAKWAQLEQLVEVESVKAVDIKEAELKRKVELKNALTQTEKSKAEYLSKASVEYDVKKQKQSRSLTLYEKQISAEAQKLAVEAQFSPDNKPLMENYTRKRKKLKEW
ncbi:hypothetical protein MKW92_038338 [Papaver armeniacum]|nr:hypothetical protein MKW92_038338 [Papaver armeniacum]